MLAAYLCKNPLTAFGIKSVLELKGEICSSSQVFVRVDREGGENLANAC
jgi:hypothetical protein